MKVVVVAAALALALSAFACTTVLNIDGDDASPSPAEGGRPRGREPEAEAAAPCELALDTLDIDLGQILKGGNRSLPFAIENFGSAPTDVNVMTTTAAPFVVLVDASTVPPGGRVAGTATLQPPATDTFGPQVKQLRITSAHCSLQAPLRAQVVDQDYVATGIDFRDVPCGTSAPAEDLLLTASPAAPLAAMWAMTLTPSPPVLLTGATLGSIARSEQVHVGVSFTAPMGLIPAPISQKVGFTVTATPAISTQPGAVEVKARPVGAYVTFNPKLVAFGGQTTANVTITNAGNAAAGIAFTASAGWTPPFTIPSLAPGATKTLIVQRVTSAPNATGTLTAMALNAGQKFCGSDEATLQP